MASDRQPDKGTVDPKDAPNTPARRDVRTADGDHPSPYTPANTPTLTVTASIEGGDERHGIEVLLGSTVHAQDDKGNINVEGVPWDTDVTIRAVPRNVVIGRRPEDLPEGSLDRIQMEREMAEADKALDEGSDAAKAKAHGMKEAEERAKSNDR